VGFAENRGEDGRLSETKHTPGPWRGGQDGNLRVYGPDATEHAGLIAQVFKGRGNVNLIAAAPELLESLEEIWEGYSILGGSQIRVERARAAIAKARGEA
jgi:hypothetical protein